MAGATVKQDKVEKLDSLTGILLKNVKYDGQIKKIGEVIEFKSVAELEELIKQGICSQPVKS